MDVTIPGGAAPGRSRSPGVTSAGRVEVPFTLTARGRIQGVGADDVIYRIMPDRFANGDTLENLRRDVTDRPNPSKHPG